MFIPVWVLIPAVLAWLAWLMVRVRWQSHCEYLAVKLAQAERDRDHYADILSRWQNNHD